MWFVWVLIVYYIVSATINVVLDGERVELGFWGALISVLLAVGCAVFLL